MAETESGDLTLALGGLNGAVEERLGRWAQERFAERLWQKDPTLWAEEPLPAELADRLGWLDLPRTSFEKLDTIRDFAEDVRTAGFTRVVLLGMGGSSLAPEVFQAVFGAREGFPRLTVLDSTHPAAVQAVEHELDPRRVFFVVSSKSGTTVETLSLFRYFWHWLDAQLASTGVDPASHFAAITDPGSPLQELAHERGFRAVFTTPPDVGGRYSALAEFGLVPAALVGVDVGGLLVRARRGTPEGADGLLAAGPGANPALRLGAALGEAARSGRDKLTLSAPPPVDSFPVWIEQLVAESTGKQGRGIVPVVGEPLLEAGKYGDDRFFVHLALEGRSDEAEAEPALRALEEAGHPVARIRLPDGLELGAQILLWEIAVAAAGEVLGIHPFDQPDVELAKQRAKEALREGGTGGGLHGVRLAAGAGDDRMREAVSAWALDAHPPRYAAIQAFLPRSAEIDHTLRALRSTLADRTGVATAVGYGPRFLHSTGQLHKGGPDTGLFLQLVDSPADELPVPESETSFRALVRAQGIGDLRALEERGRQVLRIELERSPGDGLARIQNVLEEIL